MPKTEPRSNVHWFETVGSTMTVAADLAREGAPHGTIVGADEQTAGIGRHGHSWISERGAGLYVSFVLRIDSRPVISLALGLAARAAIIETTGLTPDLRWPNDVLINERKVAGVLAQSEPGAVIAGIGINVRQPYFPGDLDTPATSLTLEGATVSREDLLTALAKEVDTFTHQQAEEILRAFTAASSYVRGKRVRTEHTIGTTCGLDPSGFLKIREDNGVETVILAGGVRPIGANQCS